MANVPMAMDITSSKSFLVLFELLVAGLGGSAAAQSALLESHQLTPSGEYTFGIEGPAVDAAGTLYVVNFQRQGTIGKLSAGAAA